MLRLMLRVRNLWFFCIWYTDPTGQQLLDEMAHPQISSPHTLMTSAASAYYCCVCHVQTATRMTLTPFTSSVSLCWSHPDGWALKVNCPIFWWVAVNTFKVLCIYDMMLVLLKWNGKMLMKWLSQQFWSYCLYMHVLIETAVERHVLCKLTLVKRASALFLQKHAEQEGFMFKSTFEA